MARKNRHNAAFVVGAVLGGLVGSAAALWKTPYSGEELRAKLAGEPSTSASATMDGGAQTYIATSPAGRSMKDKVLSTVEQTLAPVVGVELGKTANNSGLTSPDTHPTPSISDFGKQGVGESPAFPDEEPMGGPATDEPETGGSANVTPVDEGGGEASELSSPTRPAADHEAASVEELTTPQTDTVPDALLHEHVEKQPFPKLGGNEPT